MLSDEVVITGKRALARSYAKINLTLDVLGRRDNGYHDVEMVMQTVSLFDLLIIDKCYGEISVKTNLHYLPDNDKNIAYKAAKAFFDYTHIRSSVKIMIHKNIPVAAGLAGGSGNAAAVLCALDKLYGTTLSREELFKLGTSLGADVPYCIMGGTAIASGIGEILTPIKPLRRSHILLVKPPINISTAAIYEEIDSAKILRRPDTAAMCKAIADNDINAVADNLCNVMESITEKRCPVISGIKKKMRMNGAVGTLMSGSGPTVFGIFDDYNKAKRSHDSFSRQYKDVFLVEAI
ncbi:MAG: 4-(cytidine 5'-diphospho)-2-C-methyl-D-erythritol kinase [bacterium]|nr:4-(cytidine 5'-diphospho)-2-C-methyl-D-erythritol kinase [bacterium]